jgi:hypothetical protein
VVVFGDDGELGVASVIARDTEDALVDVVLMRPRTGGDHDAGKILS